MSYFDVQPNQAIVEALAAGDWESAAAMMDDNSRAVEDSFAVQQIVPVSGTLDGAGAGTAAHGVSDGAFTVRFAQAFYKGTGGEFMPLTVDQVDGTDVVVSGGAAGQPFIAALMIAPMPVNW